MTPGGDCASHATPDQVPRWKKTLLMRIIKRTWVRSIRGFVRSKVDEPSLEHHSRCGVFTIEGWDEAAADVKAAALKRMMQTEPRVECTDDSMQLKVKGSFSTPGTLFLVDRGKIICIRH